MRRYGAAVRRRRLDARRSLLQNPFDDPHSLRRPADRRAPRQLRLLQILRLAAGPPHVAGFERTRNLQKQRSGRLPRPEKPLYHLQRLLSRDRREDDDLLFQGDRSIQRLRPHPRGRQPDSGGRLGRQYGARLRQSLLGQQHSAAVVGARREHLGALVRPVSTPASN